MRLLSALGLYFLFVFVGGALCAPWLHSLVGWAAEQIPSLEGLAYQPFHRYVNRCFLVLAIVGLWPLSRFAKLTQDDLGWGRSKHWKKLVGTGLCVGFASLALPAIMCMAAQQRNFHWPEGAGQILKHFGNAVGAAVLVAVLEESVFRGVLFSACRRDGAVVSAAWCSSGIYALVHFFERTRHEGEVVWSSGLSILPHMMRGFTDWQLVIPGFFSLLVAGLILAHAVRVTGSLYFSIGIHAAWIFWLKTFKFFTRESATGDAWVWGTGKLIDGWFSLGALLLTWWVLSRFGCFVKKEAEEDVGNTRSGEEAAALD